MPSVEITRLTRRVDKHDEDIRVLGDTLIDIKSTVDQHSETLAEHTAILGQHTAILEQHTATLEQHTAQLTGVEGTLERHGGLLVEILRRLPAS